MRAPAGPLTPDLCVIGAGSGGLSVAAGAVQMGASVVLVEAGEMGGDCLNAGCVPSKSLIAAAAAAEAQRRGGPLGVAPVMPGIDYAAAMGHVQHAIAAIAPHDSQERFEGLGVTVIRARARFTGAREVEAAGTRIRARRFVVATGSRPAVPAIPGLEAVPYLTNETLWRLRERPDHLVILGGGPIGIEMAQAHLRLGSRVTVIEAARALGREEPDIAARALGMLRAEGVEIREGAAATAARRTGAGVALTLADGSEITGSHLLVAVGRRANVGDLGLEAAGIAHDTRGIAVTRGLRSTTNRRVYAVGDVAGGPQFTHVAGYHAGLVVRSALFRLPVRARTDHVPRVTFMEPELAAIGLTEAEARAAHGDRVEAYSVEVAELDRAQATGETGGLARLVADRRGRILGVSILAPRAGELIQPWALAMSAGLGMKHVAGHVAAYPTFGDISKKLAGAYYRPRLFESGLVRRVVRLLARLG